MSARVVLSPQAERDADDIAAYIAIDSLDTALRFYEAVWETFERLASAPDIGRVRELPHPGLVGLRSVSIEGFRPFLVFYVHAGDVVRVLRVLHGAREIDSQLP